MLKSKSKFAKVEAWKTGLRFVFLGLVALVLNACSESGSKPDDKLVAAFVEMRVAEQIYGEGTPMTRLIRRDIMNKYGYNRENFIEAVDKILDDETRWMPFQLAVTDRVDSLLGIPKPKPQNKKDKK